MIPDFGKISDAFKTAITAAGIYKLAVASACAAYWFCAARGIIPGAETWELRASAAGVIFFGFLWAANAIGALLSFFRPRDHLAYWITNYKHARHVRNYIPNMTDQEREIIGYLLAKNQKTFIAAHDGGNAMPLISQKIVITALQEGQGYNFENVPMVIPDYVWKVLQEHKDQFPYKLPRDGREVHPWRIHWMAR